MRGSATSAAFTPTPSPAAATTVIASSTATAQPPHLPSVGRLLASASSAASAAPAAPAAPAELFKEIRQGHYDAVKALFKRGVAVDARDPNGNTPLILACQNGPAPGPCPASFAPPPTVPPFTFSMLRL